MATITLGPVIGRTSDTASRVLVEADADARATCIARSGSHETSRTLRLRAGRPRAFAFDDLRPGRRYRLRFDGATCRQRGRIRTLGADAEGMNVAAVSCNFTIRKGDVDLWDDLWTRYVEPAQVDLLLHCGDQVYGDAAFQEAIGRLGVEGPSSRVRDVDPEVESAILESYRRLYRMTWRHPPTRRVLANVPSLAIWDDHEIRDDWGSRPEDRDPRSASRTVGRLARRVYREYQRQLWDDVDPDADPDDGLEGHVHRFGRFGFLFVDQRGGRSFGRDEALPYLSSAQWRAIEEALRPGGALG
ncbi:MAG: alkaline phosphatase D family protein, partial [Myxococcota bacterium]|nr:alkaline phosphatase D family protein [Myxococcota bacterium]